MSVSELRQARDVASVKFMEFSRCFDRYKTSALYSFFEGEDGKYYQIRIDLIAKPEKHIPFRCGGKQGVLKVHELISSKDYYLEAKVAYFIDRDFDNSIYEKSNTGAIYETPCHSIENLYTSVSCFRKILQSEFGLEEHELDSPNLNDDFKKCVDIYTKCVDIYIQRQTEFHAATAILNAWIACHIARSNHLCLREFDLGKLVKIKLDEVKWQYTVDDLYNEFSDLDNIPEEEIIIKKYELLRRDCQKSFRGKFEIKFLFSILKQIKEELSNKKSKYFPGKTPCISMAFLEKTLISDLSQYADTPCCLRRYLQSLQFTSPNV